MMYIVKVRVLFFFTIQRISQNLNQLYQFIESVHVWCKNRLYQPKKMKIRYDLRRNCLILIILILGLFLRLYKAQELFLYGHDHDLAGWFVRDVVENMHFRLIGQDTSTQGIFIGPVYYYLLVPFYLLSGMDPIGG